MPNKVIRFPRPRWPQAPEPDAHTSYSRVYMQIGPTTLRLDFVSTVTEVVADEDRPAPVTTVRRPRLVLPAGVRPGRVARKGSRKKPR